MQKSDDSLKNQGNAQRKLNVPQLQLTYNQVSHITPKLLETWDGTLKHTPLTLMEDGVKNGHITAAGTHKLG